MLKTLLFILALSLRLSAQGQEKLEPSDPNFAFKDGIYFTLQHYKDHSPSITFEQLCDKNGKPLSSFELNKTIYYKNSEGLVKSIAKEDLLGYGFKGNFYIKVNYNGTFFPKLVVIGSLSHFVCEIPTVTYNNYNYGPGSTTNYVLIQFLFDYETGVVNEFEQDNLIPYLQRDEELFSAYNALPKKKKRDLMFLYLRKYNERHKVHFPR